MSEKNDGKFHGGRTYCPCPVMKCKRHGKCDECIARHGRKGKLPRCER